MKKVFVLDYLIYTTTTSPTFKSIGNYVLNVKPVEMAYEIDDSTIDPLTVQLA